MKQILCVLLFLFLYVPETEAQSRNPVAKDTVTKKYRWFVTTYPSSIVTGDISLGSEFSYKRIRQEVALFYKAYNVIPGYYYNRGFGANYYLKFDFVKRKNFLMSLDMGYVYRKAYFENKVITLAMTDLGIPLSQYKADRCFSKSGGSVGLSSLMRLSGRFYFGINACLDFVFTDYKSVTKEHISGFKITKPDRHTEMPLPIVDERRDKTLSTTFLVKIAYEL